MRRRDIFGLLGAAATWSVAARAQQGGRIYRLGFLIPASRESIAAFFDELRIHGFVEGQNLAAIGNFSVPPERSADYAKALVEAAPDAIICGPEVYAHALRAATRTIPVASMSEDLVGEGLVKSLARPEGNITGISLLSPELDGKRLEILTEAVPGAKRIAVLAHSTIVTQKHLDELKALAQARGIELIIIPFTTAGDIATALERAKSSGAEAINFLASPHQVSSRKLILDLMADVRLPAIYQWPETPELGGLIGYGPLFVQVYRQRARQIVKILRGAKPEDVPVEQPSNFELAINLKTAKAIGLEIPAGLVLRADKIIE
jgi:putative ABC transport system substrate-binding protein